MQTMRQSVKVFRETLHLLVQFGQSPACRWIVGHLGKRVHFEAHKRHSLAEIVMELSGEASSLLFLGLD
jgi:hypothetical protein